MDWPAFSRRRPHGKHPPSKNLPTTPGTTSCCRFTTTLTSTTGHRILGAHTRMRMFALLGGVGLVGGALLGLSVGDRRRTRNVVVGVTVLAVIAAIIGVGIWSRTGHCSGTTCDGGPAALTAILQAVAFIATFLIGTALRKAIDNRSRSSLGNACSARSWLATKTHSDHQRRGVVAGRGRRPGSGQSWAVCSFREGRGRLSQACRCPPRLPGRSPHSPRSALGRRLGVDRFARRSARFASRRCFC